jgi:ATP-dependent Lhr-like helicase
LERLRGAKRLFTQPPHPTPFAFPILVDRLRETLTTESIGDRIQKMAVKLEAEAERPRDPS